MTTQSTPTPGSPAWLRAHADKYEKLAPHLGARSDHEIWEEIAGLRAAADALEKAEADKARLDSRCIRIVHRDVLGDDAPCIHTQIDLRAAIDAARKETP